MLEIQSMKNEAGVIHFSLFERDSKPAMFKKTLGNEALLLEDVVVLKSGATSLSGLCRDIEKMSPAFLMIRLWGVAEDSPNLRTLEQFLDEVCEDTKRFIMLYD